MPKLLQKNVTAISCIQIGNIQGLLAQLENVRINPQEKQYFAEHLFYRA